jgi:BirA family transcriptional regulator, biotin operon repressor / biotin---[acetyl-CoA-carboxylase] ligase
MAFDIGWVRSQLPDRRIDWYPSVGSTMTEAIRLAAEGCESGTMVIADEQTAGQGRLGRRWHSEPASGLYTSFILRRSFGAKILPLVTMALGLATAEAILKTTDLACDLRWPNDVLIDGRKCAGILTQLEGSAIIAGIGINVNHAAFPRDLSGIATSLRIAGGGVHSRERLLVELASSIDGFLALLEDEGREPILKMFSRASSFVYGRRVQVDLGDSILKGTTAGLDESGFLIVRGDDGGENVIVAGGVRPCS